MDISNHGLFDSIILNVPVGAAKIESANPIEVRTTLASYTQRRFACSQCQASLNAAAMQWSPFRRTVVSVWKE
jgi:hypothetical protein